MGLHIGLKTPRSSPRLPRNEDCAARALLWLPLNLHTTGTGACDPNHAEHCYTLLRTGYSLSACPVPAGEICVADMAGFRQR
eukprot:6851093-Prymnesium_polylepis.1